MSLICCSDWKIEISHKAKTCIHCGCPVPEKIRDLSDEFVDEMYKKKNLDRLIPTQGVDDV